MIKALNIKLKLRRTYYELIAMVLPLIGQGQIDHVLEHLDAIHGLFGNI